MRTLSARTYAQKVCKRGVAGVRGEAMQSLGELYVPISVLVHSSCVVVGKFVLLQPKATWKIGLTSDSFCRIRKGVREVNIPDICTMCTSEGTRRADAERE